jgi:hypothetical protein
MPRRTVRAQLCRAFGITILSKICSEVEVARRAARSLLEEEVRQDEVQNSTPSKVPQEDLLLP